MYQLFKCSTSSLQRSLPLSLRSLRENTELTASQKTCLLCKHINLDFRLQLRKHSSVTHPSVNKTKKVKRKRSGKKFSDVFVVTDEFSGLKKANITKLKANELNLFATTNLNLNELYKLKELANKNKHQETHTYSNLAVEDITSSTSEIPVPTVFQEDASCVNDSLKTETLIESVGDPEVPNANLITEIDLKEHTEIEAETDITEAHIESELEFKNLGVQSTFQPEVEEETHEYVEAEEPKGKQKETVLRKHIDQKQRDVIVSKTLAAYIEVCNYLKNPQRGLQAVNFHRGRVKSQLTREYFPPLKNVSVYHALLKGFASKGDYGKLSHVLSIMEEEQVEPDLHCYVAIFECLGRINISNHYLKEIRIFGKEAIRKNFTFDLMMNQGVFINDERMIVLKAFKAFDPNYVPKYEKPEVWYNNSLLNHLNHEDQQVYKLNVNEYNPGLFTSNFMNDKVQEQVKKELHGFVTIKSIEPKGTPSKEVLQYRQALENQYETWAESAEKAFQRDLATLAAHRSPLNLEPYMRCIPLKDFVDIMVEEAKKIAQGSETYSPELGILYKGLGQRVYARYRVVRKQKGGLLEKILKVHSKYCQTYASLHEQLECLPEKEVILNPRMHWQWIAHEHMDSGADLNMIHQPWVPATINAIGKFLYHIIMHDLKIDVNCMRPNSKHKNLLPAFYTIFRTTGRIVKEEVKPHPVLSRLYRASEPETLTFPAYEVPMVCPPVPWTSVHSGGYMISPTDFVRLPSQAITQKQRMLEAPQSQLFPNYDALNQLAAVPWKVNTKILDVILEVFRSGGSSKLDVPEPPASLPPPPIPTPDMDKTEKYQLFKLKLQHKRKKAEMYSLWCDCLYRLSLANHFRDDVFWLPHNMDFRGRVYPVPPHLNHLGSDLARSMLVFAEARPLGPKGLDWLKIHLINLTGLKKRNSVQERLSFANDMMALILDSADNPLNGLRWWAESDEPWQTLACCMEIANVVRSGINPAEYRSHFPVHQDGSCNGLQHYAALGRDSAGAFSVNLAPCDIPQDVYSAVVALVEEQRAKDELEGVEVAKSLNGYVKRKVIKQTIMTTVYGVTKFGARLQIAKQLKDIDSFPKDLVWAASSYLTARTFESLRTMFTSTREIQDWFTECARLVSAIGGQNVEWVTPLGLPIVQPYTKYRKLTMPSNYQSFPLDKFEKPNVMKQKNAFPPNFIHSLDSNHMMLTSLHSERVGITFVSVHDCYWTHPSTVDIMNRICREQFVALHSEPILENLSLFFYDKYSYDNDEFSGDGSVSDLTKKKLNRILRTLPKTGDFDIRNVLNSIYFFS